MIRHLSLKGTSLTGQSDLAAKLLSSVGVLFGAAALLYNEFLIALAFPAGHLTPTEIQTIRFGQFVFLGTGMALLAAGAVARRLTWFQRGWIANLLLVLFAFTLPVYVLEVALRPFADFQQRGKKTTIYIPDPELGWKHRPNAEDEWSGTPVKINAKGLRGPELPYEKPAGVTRILYLGDSVTFGDQLKSDEEVFPFLVGKMLEQRLGLRIETINSGVSGYSPWQEHLYLVHEGIRYSPDLVVVGFVLNDVTEKFELVRFGGSGLGWQLSHSYTSWFDRLADRSAIANRIRRIAERNRFGQDVRKGAKQKELLDVKSLVFSPDDQNVKEAWRATLAEVERIYTFCDERKLPVVMVVFPYRFQYDGADPSMLLPQQIVSEHARQNRTPVLDLFPLLGARMAQDGRKTGDYFIDSVHLTPLGNQVVAEFISKFIEQVLPNHPKGQ